ncbi:MAG: penicillin-binding protein 2 [Bacillota bacterium]
MNKRLKIVKFVVIAIIIFLVLRGGHLQLISGDYYFELSEGNRISLRPINAPRGKIIDKNGEIIASNKLSYNLYLLPNEVSPKLKVEDVIDRLSEFTNLDTESLKEKYRENNDIYNSSLLLKRNISSKNMISIEENTKELPGLVIEDSFLRQYPFDNKSSHVLGYVGQINEELLKKFNEEGKNYRGGDIIGIAGLEKEYESYLNGKNGVEQIEVNNMGYKVKTIGMKSPEPGNDLVLNIDLDLEARIENKLTAAFEDLKEEARDDEELTVPTGASAIVLDVNTGAVRAMTSIPNFDPNNFSNGISEEKYNKLQNDPNHPLLNRNIMSAIPPGSIFKLVTGTAGIKYLDIDANTEFVDENAKFYIPDWSQPFRNWNPVGEGKLEFTKAIARSNNIVFYKIGYRLYEKYKGEKLIETAREYGLGEKTGIDLPQEKSGLVPDREWKQEEVGEGWYPGDSVNLSIGQGGLLTTPLQLSLLVSSIANEGTLYKPQIVDKIIDDDGNIVKDFDKEVKKDLPFSKNTYNILKNGMEEVTNAEYGTASSVFEDFPIKIAGKTGTAETGISNHGWFAGFAPADDPEIVVVVFLENGNSSSNTLPVAKEIFNEYFGLNKKAQLPIDQSVNSSQDFIKSNNLINFFKTVFLEN